MDKRRMCPNCRAFVTTDDRVCPYCEVRLGARAVERREASDQLIGGIIPHAHFATALLILINVGFFAATKLGGQVLVEAGAKYGPYMVYNHQWWRLITAGYFHGGWLHIIFNMFALYTAGAAVEMTFGLSRFVVIYTVANACGFLASVLWMPNVPSIGASAAIFGLIGAMVALGTMMRSAMGAYIRSQYLQWAGYGLVMAFFMPGIDNAAHVGGFIGGFATAWVAGQARLYENWREKIWRILAVICVIATLYAFAEMFLLFMSIQKSGA